MGVVSCNSGPLVVGDYGDPGRRLAADRDDDNEDVFSRVAAKENSVTSRLVLTCDE